MHGRAAGRKQDGTAQTMEELQSVFNGINAGC